MARVNFPSNLRSKTGGIDSLEVSARKYSDLVVEVCRRFPELSEDELRGQSMAIDGLIIAKPALETFGADSNLVFFARIAGG